MQGPQLKKGREDPGKPGMLPRQRPTCAQPHPDGQRKGVPTGSGTHGPHLPSKPRVTETVTATGPVTPLVTLTACSPRASAAPGSGLSPQQPAAPSQPHASAAPGSGPSPVHITEGKTPSIPWGVPSRSSEPVSPRVGRPAAQSLSRGVLPTPASTRPHVQSPLRLISRAPWAPVN